jgi:hypothetical protein
VRVLFNKAGGSGGKSKRGGPDSKKTEEPKERIQNTAEDLDKFIKSKLDSGICQLGPIRDGRKTYEFIKKDGIFKRGDIFTKDYRHFEAEWWHPNGAHKGAIEPKGGTLYKAADASKHLNVK